MATLEIDKSSVSRRVKSAIEAGFLVNEEQREGFPMRLKLGDPLPEEQEVLPTVDQLRAA